MPSYGRPSGTDSIAANLTNHRMRGNVFKPMPEHGWGFLVGGHIGKVPGGPDTHVRYGIYRVGADGAPSTRIAYTDVINMTTSMALDGSGGAIAVADVVQASGLTNLSQQLYSGVRYAIAVTTFGGDLRVGYIPASQINQVNENVYEDFGLTSSTPPSAFDIDLVSALGWCSLWIDYAPNTKPVATPGTPSGAINDTTPTLHINFSDAEEMYGDRLYQHQVYVERTSDHHVMWQPAAVNATVSEQSSDMGTQVYAGSTLVPGVPYRFRGRVSDQFGAWSVWSAWQNFTVDLGGFVEIGPSPNGKQEAITGLNFTGFWNDIAGLDMTHYQMRLAINGKVAWTSTIHAQTVAGTTSFPGTPVTITQASMAMPLQWATSYFAQIKPRNSAGIWSDWEAAGWAFTTDAPPSIPSKLSPSGNAVFSGSYPILSCIATDPDDTVASGLAVVTRIKDSAGTVLQTRTMTYNTTRKRFEYQTTPSDFTTPGTYKYDCSAFDGTLYSGKVTTSGSRAWSGEAVFIYQTGIAVTVSAPVAGPISTNTPMLAWSLPVGQVQTSFRILAYVSPFSGEDSLPVYDSLIQIGTGSSWTIPSGYLHNTFDYDFFVEVTTLGGTPGTSAPLSVSLAYPALTPVEDFSAVPEALRFDTDPSAILLAWSASPYNPDDFEGFTITKREAGQSVTQAIILARYTSPSQKSHLDGNVKSGVEYVYSIIQEVMQGTDRTTSPVVEASAIVTFPYVRFQAVDRPDEYRLIARAWSDHNLDGVLGGVSRLPFGAAKPTFHFGSEDYTPLSLTLQFVDDDGGPARDYYDQGNKLIRRKNLVSYGDPRGDLLYGVIDSYRWTKAGGGMYILQITFTETNWKEGAPA